MKKISVFYPFANLNHPVTGGQIYDSRFFKILEKNVWNITYLNECDFGASNQSALRLMFKLILRFRLLCQNNVLICNTTLFPYYLIPFFFIRLFCREIKIYGIHHHNRYQEQNGFKKYLYKFLELLHLSQYDTIICPCPYTRDVIIQQRPNLKTILLENAFENTPTIKSDYSEKRLLFVGTVYARKGLHFLVDAIGLLSVEDKKNLEVTIVGSLDDVSYVDSLRCKITQNQLESIVKLTGRMDESKLDHYYATAYAFVFPSLLEGYGLVLIEAMKHGLPVVAFNNSAMPYTIRHEYNGLLARQLDVDDFSTQIHRLLSDPTLHLQCAEGAIKTSTGVRTIEQLEKEIVEFTRNLSV